VVVGIVIVVVGMVDIEVVVVVQKVVVGMVDIVVGIVVVDIEVVDIVVVGRLELKRDIVVLSKLRLAG